MHERHGKHLEQKEIDYQLNKFGRIVENKLVCPYCGLIIEPAFETEQKGLYREERVCPECTKKFLLSSVPIQRGFCYATYRKGESDE